MAVEQFRDQGLSGITLVPNSLVELLLQVSSGKSPAGAARSWAGVRTYLGMQSLLGRGLRGGGRRELLAELRRMQLIEREVIA